MLNTGLITLGNGTDTITFAGGLDTTSGMNGTSIGGTVLTTDTQMDLGAVTLTATSELDSGTAAASIINIGAVTRGTNALTLDAGSAAVITVDSLAGNGALTVRDSGGTTFTNGIAASTVTLTGTTGTVEFGGSTTISAGLVTTAQGYGVSFLGLSNSVAGDTTFANTGLITLGNACHSNTSAGALDTTSALIGTCIGGTVLTTDTQMHLRVAPFTSSS